LPDGRSEIGKMRSAKLRCVNAGAPKGTNIAVVILRREKVRRSIRLLPISSIATGTDHPYLLRAGTMKPRWIMNIASPGAWRHRNRSRPSMRACAMRLARLPGLVAFSATAPTTDRSRLIAPQA